MIYLLDSNLSLIDIAFNATHKYIRAIVENIFADIDNCFSIHNMSMPYSWRYQAGITLSIHLLYNVIKKIVGPVALHRYDT